MKTKNRGSNEMTRLNGAAFRIGREAAQEGNLEQLLDDTLARVFGGLEIVISLTVCTEFSCNLYAPR